MLRRVLICAIGLGVLAGAAACSPVKMGAAATVGSQRITVTQLDNQVASLNQYYPKYAAQVQNQLPAAQIPAAVLSWLIRFRIAEQVAANEGLTVTQQDGQAALNFVQSQAQKNAAQSGQTFNFDELLVANGIPPTQSMKDELGRYQAIEFAWLKQRYGSSPTTATQSQVTDFGHAQCVAAKSLSIAVNPQFGRMDYSNYSVAPTTDLLSKASGASSSPPSSAGASPSC